MTIERSVGDDLGGTNTIREGFVRTLVDDVLQVFERLQAADTQAHRRDVIRTTFTAIEGVTWVFRETVAGSAADLNLLDQAEEIALREKSYMVSDKGEVLEQTRIVPLTSMIRLITKVAERTFAPFKADFSHVGWSYLKSAIAIRNRLMHPKSNDDLSITAEDVRITQAGFFWLLALVIEGMQATNDMLHRYNEEARSFVDLLRAGDPATVAEYRRNLSD